MTDQIADYVDNVTALISLPLTPAGRDEVVAAMRIILEQAALLMDFDLPDEIEPAPTFHP